MDLEEFNHKAKEIFENKVVPQIIKAKMKQTAMQMAIDHYKKLSEQGSNQAYVVAKFLEENYLEIEKEQRHISIDEQVEILKDTLEEMMTGFDTEENRMDFILDLCNGYKKRISNNL